MTTLATERAQDTQLGGRQARQIQHVRNHVIAWLLLLPSCIALIAFVIAPMILDIPLSFRDARLTSPRTRWVGLANWHQVLTDNSLPSALAWTAVYTATTVSISLLLGLTFALALVDRPRLRKVVGTIVLLPVATSIIVGSAGWIFLFDVDGAINRLLLQFGIHGPNYLDDPTWAKVVLILVGWWGSAGFALLLYEAGLSRVPRNLRDAARLYNAWEGVGAKLRMVVPLLRRTTVVAVVVSSIVSLRAFDAIYALTQGGPYGTTQTLAFMVWQQSFTFFNLGTGAVAATLLIVIVLLVTTGELLYFARRKELP